MTTFTTEKTESAEEAPTHAASGRLQRAFEAHRATLIPYITAGYPTPGTTAPLLDVLVASGAGVIELGVPFSDPVADGPTIQRASQRAIENGITLEWCLEAVRSFRSAHDTPVVLFSYLNPILRHGVRRFLADAHAAGIDGVLLTDLPVGADEALEQEVERSPLSLIRLIAPTTTRERAMTIARRAQGFVYYIARMGVTGRTAVLRKDLAGEIAALREVTAIPIAVGFGISTPSHAAQVARMADGVVVGSALIDALDAGGVGAAAALLSSMRTELDAMPAA